MDFTRHSKRPIRRELLGYSFAVSGPVCGTNELFREDFGDICPISFVIKGILAVALRGPRFLKREVCRYCHCEELIGPVHIEGFSASCEVWIQHLSMGKAVRDVVDDIVGNFDSESGTIL